MIKQVSRIVLVCVCVASAALLNSCGGKPEDKSSTVEAKAEPAPPAIDAGDSSWALYSERHYGKVISLGEAMRRRHLELTG